MSKRKVWSPSRTETDRATFGRRPFLIGAVAVTAAGCVPEWGQYPDEEPDVGKPKPWDAQGENGLPPVVGEPLLLSASATIYPNAQGDVNSQSLANPDGQPMLIDEIRFQVMSTGKALGGVLGCDLKIVSARGGIPLTSGFPSVWSFGKMENPRQEFFEAGTPLFKGVAEYVWRLHKPLFIPGNMLLVPKFQLRPYLGVPVDVKISYSCRKLPPMGTPQSVEVPYVAYYESKPFVLDGSVQTDISQENILLNPFNKALLVERLTGRYMHHDPGFSNASGAVGQMYEVYDSGGLDTFDTLLTVRMTNSAGDPVVRLKTPFREIFNPLTRSWEIPHEMSPLSHYKAFLETGLPSINARLPSNGTQYGIAQIALVGYREVSGSDLGGAS